MLTRQNLEDMRTCSDHHCEKCSLFAKEQTCAEQIAIGALEIIAENEELKNRLLNVKGE